MTDEQLAERFIDYCTSPDRGQINPNKMRQARLIAEWSRQEIYEVLMDLQMVNLEGLNRALSEITGHPALDPLSESLFIPFSEQVLSTVSHRVAIENRVFPVRIENGELHLVMANPTDDNVAAIVERMAGYPIRRYVCYPKHILRAIVRYYNRIEGTFEILVREALDEVRGEREIKPRPSIWTEPLSQALFREVTLFPNRYDPPKQGEVGVSIILQKIIVNAIYQNVSDIHFEPFEDVIKVRFRKDGMLFSQWFIPRELQKNLTNRIKVMAGMDLTVAKQPQDGHIAYENQLPVGVDIRASTIPSMHGERITLRILDKSRVIINPKNLGLEDKELTIFRRRIESPQGLILMTGPTGSGKTTSIYAALDHLNSEHRCIITIEDPVEYELNGISQIQVDARFDMDFAKAFRSILRQNPDVILLGEIRDSDSAKVAVNAASTGHLVFSTLHTNDAANAIPRLITLGADSYVLSNALQLIVAQRLARRLCPHCRITDPLDDQRLETLGLNREELGDSGFYTAGRCSRCNFMGYAGRIGVFELLEPDYRLREMIIEKASGLHIEQYAMDRGMTTLRQNAISKARQQITSLDEVVRVTTTE